MHTVNCDFGQMRLAHRIDYAKSFNLFSFNSIGWYKCNDKYRVNRPQGINLHLLIVTIGGMGVLEINNVRYNLPAGTVAFIPKNVKNCYYTPKNGKWEFYWIHTEGLTDIFLDEVQKNGIFVNKFSAHHNYTALMEDLLVLADKHTPNSQVKISHKLSTIFHHAASDLLENNESISLAQRAITYIEQNFDKNISLDDISASLYISTTHLIRIFKSEIGCTPHKYLINYRLLTGAHFLKFSPLRIDEIALKVGFSSSSQFISCFKTFYGVTPKQYRDEK